MSKINIAVAEDHPMFLRGLMDTLKRVEGVGKISGYANGAELLEATKEQKFDVIFSDIDMPVLNGIDLLKRVKEEELKLKVIMLSMSDEEHNIMKVIDLGASGYLLKNTDYNELSNAITAVLNDGFYCPAEVSAKIAKAVVKRNEQEALKKKAQKELTEREIDVLKLLYDELTSKEIAAQLFLSVKTVESHRKNLLNKTGSKNLAGIVKYAKHHHLV